MTKACLKIKMDEKWVNIEIDKITDKELDYLTKYYPKNGWLWAKFLAIYIHNNLE